MSTDDEDINCVIYVIQPNGQAHVKVGRTWDHAGLPSRLANLQLGNPYVLRVIATAHGTKAHERLAHRVFAAERLAGEWFERSDRVKAFIDALGRHSVPEAIEIALALYEPCSAPL